MPVTVKLNDVVEALDSAMEEHSYYLDKRTGEIVLLTSEELEAAEEDELISEYPDWQHDSILKAREVLSAPEEFVQLPDQFDIHEYQMMENFCLSLENRQAGQQLLRLITGSGAFRGLRMQFTRWALKSCGTNSNEASSRRWQASGWRNTRFLTVVVTTRSMKCWVTSEKITRASETGDRRALQNRSR